MPPEETTARAAAATSARAARRSGLVHVVVRSGYGGSAVLRALIGVFALLLAVRLPGPHADASGAFGAIAAVPGGAALLLVVVAGEYALGAWLVLAGVVHQDPDVLQRWRQRLVYWGRAAVYLVIGTSALRFALGAHPDSSRSEEEMSRHLLDVPGGVVVLGLTGAVIVIAGVGMVWIGAFLRFRSTVRLPRRRGARAAVLVIGVLGYVLQGASIAAVGVFVVVAACTLDPARSAGLNGTLGAFAAHPVGRAFLVTVGVGWIAAAGYAAIRAFLARLD